MRLFQWPLAKEVCNDHTAGPFHPPPIPKFQCSPIGVVPKKEGIWCIIMDLSSLQGSSMNELPSLPGEPRADWPSLAGHFYVNPFPFVFLPTSNCLAIISAGRIFLCWPIDLSTSACLPLYHVTTNCEAHHDTAWWLPCLSSWNGIARPPLDKIT